MSAPTWQADSDDGAAVILDCLFEVDEHLQVVNQESQQYDEERCLTRTSLYAAKPGKNDRRTPDTNEVVLS